MVKRTLMKLNLKHTLFIAIALFSLSGSAQLSGSYTIPGTISSIAAAVGSLNTQGVSGPVTINIAAGYTETTPAGGFQLNTVTGASAANTIVFQKSGAGANPLVTAYTGGVGTPSASTQQDGIWKFSGSDFITVDGIDLTDPNTANPATMEFGFGFFKVGTTNGCQNNVIKNCVITLNRLNSGNGSGASPSGSKGIYLAQTSASAYTVSGNVTAFSGTHSGNKFYANKIQNCHTGIYLNGPDYLGYVPHSDQLNEVGGLLAATGNTIVNFGGGAGFGNGIAYASFGIYAGYQFSLNASYNVINNNDGAGQEPATSLHAIFASNYIATDVSINSNTITLSCTANNGLSLRGINSITSNTTSNSGPAVININNNIFPSYNSISTVNSIIGAVIFTNAFPSITSINNNLLQNINAAADLYNIISCPRASTCTINSNTITNLVFNSGSHELITSDAQRAYFNGNLVSGVTHSSSSGGITGISGGFYANTVAATNNTVTNITSSICRGIDFNNNINVTFSVTGNTLSHWSSVPGSTLDVRMEGILFGNSTGYATGTVSGNMIHSLSCLGAGSPTNVVTNMEGIDMSGIDNLTISHNKIYGFASNRYGATMFGVRLAPSSTNIYLGVYNNLVGGFEAANTNNNIAGIFLNSQDATVAFNTIYLDAPNTGANTSSDAIRVNAAFSSVATATLKNNILVNLLPATGTGTASAVNIFTVSSYGQASDRNILYTGIPAANRVVAKIGTASYSLIAAFKSAVFPRELQTFTESPVFTTTLGSQPDFLNLDPNIATLAESGAMPVTGVTTDYAGNARDAANPDIGAWEGSFAGFDRVAPVVTSAGFTSLPCNNFTSRTYTMAVTDASGVATGTLAPRLYYRVNAGTYSSVQGILSAGTASNGVWTFNLTYSGSAGNTISYFVALQDQSFLNNVVVLPSAGAIAVNVNTVNPRPATPDSYQLQSFPVISVNSGTICSGNSFQLFPSGAFTYTYTGGALTVSPAVTTSYSVTGTSSEGCAASNTAVATVTVYTTPTVSVNSGSICAGQPFQIVASGAASYAYTGGSAIVSPAASSLYTVTGTSAEGCASAAAIASVVVNPAPVINVNSGSICSGQSFTIVASGAASYTFSGGSAVVSPMTSTTYTVTGTGFNGCAGSDAISAVVVNELPVINVSFPLQPICSGQSVTLQASGAAVYSWQPNGASGAQVTVTPAASTSYSVTGTDANGCSTSTVAAVTVDNCVGIEKTAGEEVNIYPNPSQGRLSIALKSAGNDATVKIYNAVSQLVYTAEISGTDHAIDLGSMPKGFYLLQLQQGGRLVKQQKIVLD